MKLLRSCCICLMLLLISGCRSLPDGGGAGEGGGHRMAAYQPVSAGIELALSAVKADPDVQTNLPADEASSVGSSNAVPGVQTNVPVDEASADVSSNAVPGDVTLAPVNALPVQRVLSRGDRIMISLRGIPRPEEIQNIIDGLGEVTLPLIGQVLVAGLTTSDAERLIETTYRDRDIYRAINVIVVAEDKVYFVQGEVSRQGKFPMSGDVTLLQAITEAGGYTPFANRKKVKVIRGEKVIFYNARDIENGEENDPPVLADDIIVVQRSWY